MSQLVTSTELKAILGITDSYDNDRITTACDAATQMIQAECDRQFFLDTNASARVFVRQTWQTVEVDDIGTTSGLIVKTDDDADGVFETTWAAGDYQLEPLNGQLAGQTWPYTRIRAVEAREFPADYGRALVQITARWGWPTVPPAVKQAAQIQATALFKAADAPLGIAGFGDIGVMRLRQAMHPVALALLAPYRRDPVLVA
jgi:hypothetical protein